MQEHHLFTTFGLLKEWREWEFLKFSPVWKREASFSDPLNGDCVRKVCHTPKGFQVKTGCHGASGIRKQKSKKTVFKRVLEVSEYNINTNSKDGPTP